MSSDVEYLLLKEKGPFHDVCVRRRLDTSAGTCRFYAVVISILVVCMLSLLISLVYVFVLVPSWQGTVLTWDGRPATDSQRHLYPEAHTVCGPVHGQVEHDVHVFKGIPYARPPAGERRWKEPLEMSRSAGTCWSGTFSATKFGNSCPQPAAMFEYSDTTGHEDCLYLNVWTPSLDPLANLPVIVWFHGGFLVYLSGNTPGYSPTPELTKTTQAVYVSFNYRLGPLGFLALDLLTTASGVGRSGNYGLLDQILALRWVRDNIKNFGGNPNKVTVFGQSSGATSIAALLASPMAAGLFHRAWISSPLPVLTQTMQQAARDNLSFLNRTGCADLDCLLKLSAADLLRATPWITFPQWGGEEVFRLPAPGRSLQGALPVIDGYVLKESPLEAWRHRRGHRVPTLFTTAAQEADLMPFDLDIRNWTWSRYEDVVRQELAPFGQDVAATALEMYPAEEQASPEYQYTSLVSDVRFTCPTDSMADTAAAHLAAPVYRAVVTSFPSQPVFAFSLWHPKYAFHSWDLLAFFGDFAALGLAARKSDLDFQRVVRQQILAFAQDGQPEAPVWQPFQSCTALLSDHVFPVDHFNRDRCNYWLKKGVLSYAGGK